MNFFTPSAPGSWKMGWGEGETVPNFLYYKHQWELWEWGRVLLETALLPDFTLLNHKQYITVQRCLNTHRRNTHSNGTSSSRALYPSFGHYFLLCGRVCWDKDGHHAVAAALSSSCFHPSSSFISANPSRWQAAALCFLHTNHREKKVYSISGCVTIRKLSTEEK